MFFVELISRGGPVLYLLFLLTLIIFFVLMNKYFFIYLDKKIWFSTKLDEYEANYPPDTINLAQVENTYLSEF